MDVKGERGRNKTVQGHTHPPALLLLHTHTHTHKQTHTNLNTPSSVEGRRLTEWARDYWRDGFPVWTSDEANVNSVHVEGRDQEKRG